MRDEPRHREGLSRLKRENYDVGLLEFSGQRSQHTLVVPACEPDQRLATNLGVLVLQTRRERIANRRGVDVDLRPEPEGGPTSNVDGRVR